MSLRFDWPPIGLTPAETDVYVDTIIEHFGPLTLQEVGAILGISKQRVSKLESAALKKFREEYEELMGDELEDLYDCL